VNPAEAKPLPVPAARSILGLTHDWRAASFLAGLLVLGAMVRVPGPENRTLFFTWMKFI
jgi:hypothetical protein